MTECRDPNIENILFSLNDGINIKYEARGRVLPYVNYKKKRTDFIKELMYRQMWLPYKMGTRRLKPSLGEET